MKAYKSLRDSLLEYSVINFSEVFLKFQDPSTVGDTILPPLLFEDVLSKSKEIRWRIKTLDLENCFFCRDALRWENIEVTLSHDDPRALDSMGNLKYPIKNLSLYLRIINNDIIELIAACASSLVTLELSCLMWHARMFPIENFPKLKRLIIKRERRNSMYYSPFVLQLCQDCDTLKEVILDNQCISIQLINSLKYLTNLETLSLSYCAFEKTESRTIMEELGSLTTLRTLNLCHMNLEFDKQIVFETLKKLTNLENLDLSDSYCNEKDLQMILNSPPKKWKKLGLFNFCQSIEKCNPRLSSLADQVFRLYRVDNSECELYLSSVEYYTNNHILKTATLAKSLARNFHPIPLEQTPRVEKVLLDAFVIHHEEKKKMSSKICVYLESERCTKEFAMKIVYILCSYRENARNNELKKGRPKPEHGPEWMLGLKVIKSAIYDFLRKDLNRTVAKKLIFELKCLFIRDTYYKPSEELLRLFEDSIKHNLYDEEIRSVVGDFLEMMKTRM